MTEARMYTKEDLIKLKPKHKFLVGIDSDGCVFDTMEIKQKQCFHPHIISIWHLEPIAKYVRECAEFVNLYSKWRGTNRFPAVLMSFDLLRKRPEVIKSGVKLPEFQSLRKFVDSGAAMGNPQLQQAVEKAGDKELASVLKWSQEVNAAIAQTVKNVPPFKWVRESLEKLSKHADIVVVSQTPTEALAREWREHDLDSFVSVIAGQELGTKGEHLAMASERRYGPERVLMMGDALGDLKAARQNKAMFYPIDPGKEVDSWERFYREALDKVLNGTYSGNYERTLTSEFEGLLPDTPPWQVE